MCMLRDDASNGETPEGVSMDTYADYNCHFLIYLFTRLYAHEIESFFSLCSKPRGGMTQRYYKHVCSVVVVVVVELLGNSSCEKWIVERL